MKMRLILANISWLWISIIFLPIGSLGQTNTPYTFTTLAGLAGSPGSADGTGSAARFNQPWGVAVDSAGNLYVADTSNYTIRKIRPGGIVTTLAGAAAGWPNYGGPGDIDAIGSAARFGSLSGVAVDAAGDMYVADFRTIRKVTKVGGVSTVAGGALSLSADGVWYAAGFNKLIGVAVDTAGNVYVVDSASNTIRKLTAAGIVTTLAGLAQLNQYGVSLVDGSADGTGSAARFWNPQGLAVDGAGNLYVADSRNSTIRKVTPTGIVTTLAGLAGNDGSSDGMGSAARFFRPSGITVDNEGNLYVSDTNNHTIRKIGPGGVVTTLAGQAGIGGSMDGTGSAARFAWPSGVAVDNAGNVYVADSGNNTIRVSVKAPVIASQPQSQTVNVGNNVTFSVAADSSSLLTYRWQFNGSNLAGATNATLSLNNVTINQAGTYIVTVNNVAGTAISAPATLTVNLTPLITVQPQSQTAIAGSNVTFQVSATGTAPLNYQWQFNAVSLPSATNKFLILTNVQLANTGEYIVMVNNVAGTAKSQPGKLIVVQWTGVVSDLPKLYTNQVPFTVTLSVTPPNGTSLYIVQDQPPLGWGVTNISDKGTVMSGKVNWIFADDALRTLTYLVTPPPEALGTNDFVGKVSYQGINGITEMAITGVRECIPALASSRLAISLIKLLDLYFVKLNLSGQSGKTYQIQVANGLEPNTQWQTITTITLDNSVKDWTDPAPLNKARKFYRTVAP